MGWTFNPFTGKLDRTKADNEIDHGGLSGLTDDDHTQYTKKATLTAKGDVYGATGASTPARLGIGSNGQVLTADSGETTGMKWADSSGGGGTATLTNKSGAACVVGYVYRVNPKLQLTPSADYKWTASGSGTNEYYLQTDGGADPNLEEPTHVYRDGVVATNGSLGSLSDHEWDYGDNDSLGYSTVYYRDDTADPDTLDTSLSLWAHWNECFDAGPEFDEADGFIVSNRQACVATDTTANGSSGTMNVGGYQDVYVDGSTERDDYLYYGPTAGQLTPKKHYFEHGCIARALEARTGAGLVAAVVFTNKYHRIPNSERWGWDKHARLPFGTPVKYSGNPVVINSGGAGEWNEDQNSPCSVLWDKNTNQWIMFTQGYDSSAVEVSIGVYYCAPEDFPFGPWVEYDSNPVFEKGASGKWDDFIVQHFTIMWDQINQNFRLYYRGRQSTGNKHIGSAYSSDGLSWTRDPDVDTPVISGTDLSVPGAFTWGSRYMLYAREGAVVYLWEGDTPTSFTKHTGAVTFSGQSEGFASSTRLYLSPFFDQGVIYMWYSGYNGSVYQVGVAVNNGNRWTFVGDDSNPVLPKSGSGWDDASTLFSIVVPYQGYFVIFYGGVADLGPPLDNMGGGLATIRHPGHPV